MTTHFQLPVLKGHQAVSLDVVLARVLHAWEIYHAPLGDLVRLDCGNVIVSPLLKHWPDANQALHLEVSAATDLAAIRREVEACYTARGLACLQWIFQRHADNDLLASALEQDGFTDEPLEILQLAQLPEPYPTRRYKLVPARSGYQILAQGLLRHAGIADPAQALARQTVAENHLDDTRVDGLMALTPVGDWAGYAAVVTVNESGVLIDWAATAAADATETLLHGVLELTQLSQFRQLLAAVDAPLARQLENFGFRPVGRVARYRKHR